MRHATDASANSGDIHQKVDPAAAADNEMFEARGQLSALIYAFVTPCVLKAAVLLGIPDIIATNGKTDPDGALSVHQISAQLKSDSPREDYLERLLKHLVAKKVLKEIRDGRTGESKYGLTSMSNLLLKGRNGSSGAPMLLLLSEDWVQQSLQQIDKVVLEGGEAFVRAHGVGFWDYLEQKPAAQNLFGDAMANDSKAVLLGVIRNYHGFKEVKSMVDVAGNLGLAVGMIVQAYPHIQGFNYDRPHIIAHAPIIPGVEHVAGDMFKRVPTADAIFLKHIMHDWDDELCMKILQNCYRALPENGRVLIVDIVLGYGGVNHPLAGIRAHRDVLMLCTQSGGRERSQDDWQQLLETSGFSHMKFIELPTPECLIEAFKPTKLEQ
ncbi:hypothetical protein O6H91_21G037400 [Diphasiastrum complanatum]|uniref:Uncharacterized protein n=1 Tax=Diphasiastrum complanatum TaxID=34168 RepID=A0ACC2AJJ3_DIPCM|nr:hypothetical protein O6H91_21G037400 [Diphasiastrum complanatum]